MGNFHDNYPFRGGVDLTKKTIYWVSAEIFTAKCQCHQILGAKSNLKGSTHQNKTYLSSDPKDDTQIQALSSEWRGKAKRGSGEQTQNEKQLSS